LLRPAFFGPIALAALVMFELSLASAPGLAEQSSVPGNAVVARAAEDALIIWNANPEIAAIVSNKIPDDAANNELERNALRVLAQNLAKLEKSAKSVTVRVVYDKTGAVSPVYGAPTFAGVERYANLEMSYKDAISDREKWMQLDPKTAVPSWVNFKVTGQLPPR